MNHHHHLTLKTWCNNMFKDMVSHDISNVFLNIDIFGTEYQIEGKKTKIVIDDDELKERQGGQDVAVAESSVLFYARTKDLPKRKLPGSNLNYRGCEYLIDLWQDDMGLSTIALSRNDVM